ncbi:MAG TPA: nuclease-related domain-containing protein [Tissierellaceae bacterium]|nr:nuclease-related domain-containing protein [Tissierellaceae bacterium]
MLTYLWDMSILLIIVSGIFLLPKYITYRNSDYGIASSNSFLRTIGDKGIYGEFITFTYLEKIKGYNKILANIYLPKKDGSTTEIDLLMVTETGIYVIESKNYSGWIFGDEEHKNWTQSLNNRRKNKFYNPIWQNKGHISALSAVLNLNDDGIYKSIIVFSERCELKKIRITSENTKLIKRNKLIKIINDDIKTSSKVLSKSEIGQIYLRIKEFTCVDEKTKLDHISRLQDK